MKSKTYLPIFLLTAITLLFSCKKEPASTCETKHYTPAEDLEPHPFLP